MKSISIQSITLRMTAFVMAVLLFAISTVYIYPSNEVRADGGHYDEYMDDFYNDYYNDFQNSPYNDYYNNYPYNHINWGLPGDDDWGWGLPGDFNDIFIPNSFPSGHMPFHYTDVLPSMGIAAAGIGAGINIVAPYVKKGAEMLAALLGLGAAGYAIFTDTGTTPGLVSQRDEMVRIVTTGDTGFPQLHAVPAHQVARLVENTAWEVLDTAGATVTGNTLTIPNTIPEADFVDVIGTGFVNVPGLHFLNIEGAIQGVPAISGGPPGSTSSTSGVNIPLQMLQWSTSGSNDRRILELYHLFYFNNFTATSINIGSNTYSIQQYRSGGVNFYINGVHQRTLWGYAPQHAGQAGRDHTRFGFYLLKQEGITQPYFTLMWFSYSTVATSLPNWFSVSSSSQVLRTTAPLSAFLSPTARPISIPLNPTNAITNPAANTARINALAGLPANPAQDDNIYIFIPPLAGLTADQVPSLTLEQIIVNQNDMIRGYDEQGRAVVTIADPFNPGYSLTVALNPPIDIPIGPVPPIDRPIDRPVALPPWVWDEWRYGNRALTGINQGIQTLPRDIAYAMTGTADITLGGTTAAQQSNLRARLTTVFPFSIPFSFVAALSSMSAPPQAPRWEMDFSGTVLSGSYFGGTDEGSVIAIDLEQFESIARIIRWGVFLGFAFGLMFATRKFITW